MPRFGSTIVLSLLVSGMTGCTPASRSQAGYAGVWVMDVEDRTFLVLTLKEEAGRFTGSMSGPERWSTSDGATFTDVTPTTQTRAIARSTRTADALQIVFVNPVDKEDEDEFQVKLVGDNSATLAYVGAPFSPWPLTRHTRQQPALVAADWEPGRTYSLTTTHATPNATMAEIYEADQAARKSVELSASVDHEDAQRLERTRELLRTGQLNAGIDFRKAAFVFQHGTSADDYLFAHTLALVALAKGDTAAKWIAAASLDRYLNAINRPQIYGAGFRIRGDKVIREGAFNHTLVSDDLRRELSVPPVAEQESQFKTAMKALTGKTLR